MKKLLLVTGIIVLLATVYAFAQAYASPPVSSGGAAPPAFASRLNHFKEVEHDLIAVDDPLGPEMDRLMESVDRLANE